PFCTDVKEFGEWIDRLTHLKRIKQEWESMAKKENPKYTSDALHKFHSLPMRQLSYFYVDEADIDAVIEGIKVLYKTHEKLFWHWEKKIDIKTHLKRIKDFALYDASGYFDDEEKYAVQAIIDTISEINDENVEFMLKDLAGGLSFYLNGSLDELESEDRSF